MGVAEHPLRRRSCRPDMGDMAINVLNANHVVRQSRAAKLLMKCG